MSEVFYDLSDRLQIITVLNGVWGGQYEVTAWRAEQGDSTPVQCCSFRRVRVTPKFNRVLFLLHLSSAFLLTAFYSSKYGYKMCLRLYLNGDGTGRGTHLSLFFVVMKGKCDALLKWPFSQKVSKCMISGSPQTECQKKLILLLPSFVLASGDPDAPGSE